MFDDFRSYAARLVTFNEEEWEAMVKCLRPKSIPRKEHFLRQGEVCRYIGFIRKGYVRLYYLIGDEEVTKDFNFESAFCGSYASFITSQPSLFNVVAMEDISVYRLYREDLLTLYEAYPCWHKMGRMAIEDMFVKKEMREASFLIHTPEERYELMLKYQPHIIKRVPLKYIASYLGITAETLSRIRKSI